MGAWIDKLPNGAAMLITFTPTTVTFHSVNATGMGSGPPTTMPVAYEKQSDGSLKLTPTGDVGEPMAVRVSGPDALVIQFEGLQPRTLARHKEEQAKAGNPHGSSHGK
jgi:hypothetical protein